MDAEYESQVQCAKKAELIINKLKTEARGHLDSIRGLVTSQSRLAATFEDLSDRTDVFSAIVSKYRKHIDMNSLKDLDSNLRLCVIEPIETYGCLFPIYNEQMKKRNNKLLDYDALKGNLRNSVEKPSSDASVVPKLETELLNAKEIYLSLNQKLIDELGLLSLTLRSYLDPSTVCFLKLLDQFFMGFLKIVEEIQPVLDQVSRQQNEVEKIVNELKNLTICKFN